MPFQSQRQERWMFVNHPEMARHWASETPDIKALPQKAQAYRTTQRTPRRTVAAGYSAPKVKRVSSKTAGGSHATRAKA